MGFPPQSNFFYIDIKLFKYVYLLWYMIQMVSLEKFVISILQMTSLQV